MSESVQVAARVIVVHSHPVTQEETQSLAFVTGVRWDLPNRVQYADLVVFPNRCGQQLLMDVAVRSCPEEAQRRYREGRLSQLFTIPGVV